jgi:pyridoxamine 5'-phosphate oxidase
MTTTTDNEILQALRRDYRGATLDEADVLPDAVAQFNVWFEQARNAQVSEPNAMTLATVDEEGWPAARTVLLKGITDEGNFVFFTNYSSAKAEELDSSGKAALKFLWLDLERQIRIQGRVRRIAPEQSTAYFQSRPKGSQIGAWASPQSKSIPNREVLEARVAELEAQYADVDVLPRPEHWGGYEVIPTVIEFWQGRGSRLHDRLRYRRLADGSGWELDRLAP